MRRISFNCVCGKPYESSIGSDSYPMGYVDNDYRYHRCPHCKHIWNLRPDLPNPSTFSIHTIVDGEKTIEILNVTEGTPL